MFASVSASFGDDRVDRAADAVAEERVRRFGVLIVYVVLSADAVCVSISLPMKAKAFDCGSDLMRL